MIFSSSSPRLYVYVGFNPVEIVIRFLQNTHIRVEIAFVKLSLERRKAVWGNTVFNGVCHKIRNASIDIRRVHRERL